MFKNLLSKFFRKESNEAATKVEEEIEEATIGESHTSQDCEMDKEELVDKLIELYRQNDKLAGQSRVIAKEKLQKIPLNILKNRYDAELKRYIRLNLRKRVEQKSQNKSSTPAQKKSYIANIKKGKAYEKQIGDYFEKQGYIVKYNGIEKGKKDDSIDLIAIKKDEILFVQCKNWKENSKYKVTQQMVKAFIGDTYKFIEENPVYKNYTIKRLFVISNKILTKSAYAFIKNNPQLIDFQIIKESEK